MNTTSANTPTWAVDIKPACPMVMSNSAASSGIRNGVATNVTETDATAARSPASALWRRLRKILVGPSTRRPG